MPKKKASKNMKTKRIFGLSVSKNTKKSRSKKRLSGFFATHSKLVLFVAVFVVVGVGLTFRSFAAVPTYHLFKSTAKPKVADVADPKSVELGVKFTAASKGKITRLKFYKGPNNTGLHTASLWKTDGTLLASAVFKNETASGWQHVTLPKAIPIEAGKTYIVSYHTDSGHYSADNGFFNANYVSAEGQLSAPSSGSAGGNGVYAYSSSKTFPTNTYQASNYWVDVAFVADSTVVIPPPPPPPTGPPPVTGLPPEITNTAQAANVSWKPSATNPDTGVTDYGALHSCSAGEITQSGTAEKPYVIENCDFDGQVTVSGDYVTIKNSRFKNGYPFGLLITDIGNRADNFTGEHLDFIGSSTTEACFTTWGVKTTLRYSDLSHCVDLIKYNGGTFEFNYLHDNTIQPPQCAGCDGSHNDGMQIQGGMVDDAIIVGNNIVLPGIVQGPYGGLGPDKSFQMGGETLWNPNPCMDTITIQNNWIDGRNTYWTSFFKEGTHEEQPCYPGAQLKIVANRFYRQNDSYGNTGFVDVKGNNVWEDTGPAIFNGQHLNVTANQAVIL